MTNSSDLIEVTQADRDAAAYIHAARHGSDTPGYSWILEGEQDDDVLVQTLAAHRHSAIEEAAIRADAFVLVHTNDAKLALETGAAIRSLTKKDQT